MPFRKDSEFDMPSGEPGSAQAPGKAGPGLHAQITVPSLAILFPPDPFPPFSTVQGVGRLTLQMAAPRPPRSDFWLGSARGRPRRSFGG